METQPSAGSAGPTGSAGSTGSTGRTELTIVVDSGGGDAQRWTLRCDPPGGDHPDPAGACATIAAIFAAGGDPFAPVRKDILCTQVYGGPEKATITGTWRGQPVDASYRRTDGCQIGRWQALQAVFRAGAGRPSVRPS